MKNEFPKIINEMITKADANKLEHLNFHSFENAVEHIDRTMDFFAVHVHIEPLDDDIRRDEHFVSVSEVNTGSAVEYKTQMYWLKRQDEHFDLIDARIEKLKNTPEYQHIKEWELEDEVRLKDRVLEELNQEIQPKIIRMMKEEYKLMYEDEWEEKWHQEDIFKDRIRKDYRRKYDMPIPFWHWDIRNTWQQFYFARDKEENFYYRKGGSGSSGQRYHHCIFGHLFAIINDEKPVPTYFFRYDSRNRFLFDREENELWLNFMDIRTNCGIRETREILKNVHRIERTWEI
ncbi:hypothetical protein QUF80_07395 [Desulfococcaceae bacterium HSG8]|nr:hypothetical protein [Desulfococcaceae bacterium HSG8]